MADASSVCFPFLLQSLEFDPGEGSGTRALDAGAPLDSLARLSQRIIHLREEVSGVSGLQRRRLQLSSLSSPASSPGTVVESMSVLLDDEQPRAVGESDIVADLMAQVNGLEQKLDTALEDKADADLALVESVAASKLAQARAEEFKRTLDLKAAADNFVEAERDFLKAQVSKLMAKFGPESEESAARRRQTEEDAAECRKLLATLGTDVDWLRERKEKLVSEVKGLEMREREAKDSSELLARREAESKRAQEENNFLKSRIGQLEEDLDSSQEDVRCLEEQVVSFAKRERVLKDKLKSLMASSKQSGELEETQTRCSSIDEREEKTTDCVAGFSCEDEDGASVCGSEGSDGVSQAGTDSDLIRAHVTDFHELCMEIGEKLEETIENVESLVQSTTGLPDGKPDISYTVEEDMLDVAELNSRLQKDWDALQGILLESAGPGEDDCDWSSSSQSDTEGDEASDDMGIDSNRQQGEIGDGSETEEEEYDEGEVLQGIESPASTSDDSEICWGAIEEPCVAESLFDSEVDDTDLPCASNPIPEWKRPDQVPKLDFSSLTNGDAVVHPPQPSAESSRTPQPQLDDFPSPKPPHLQEQDTQTDANGVHAELQGLRRENQLVRATVDALLHEKAHGLANLEAAQYDISVLRCEVLRKDEEKRCMYTQLEQARAENMRLNQTLEGLEICKEVLMKEVEDSRMNMVGLSQRINQGILENTQLGCSLQAVHAQLAEAKALIGALQTAMDKSESEKSDLDRRLDGAYRRGAETESIVMATTIENERLSRQLDVSRQLDEERREGSGGEGPSDMAGMSVRGGRCRGLVEEDGQSVGQAGQGVRTLGEIVENVESEKGSRPASPLPQGPANEGANPGFEEVELELEEVEDARRRRRWIRAAALGAVGFSLYAAARKASWS
ncbi:hypothetical protein BSKO_03187 [Bryopsis sp. KO-2023]|nr:hypothetical protein BSKO_03187 [Bryopsis sp. KO-2023]